MARKKTATTRSIPGYETILADIVGLLDAARRGSARAVNAIITATYWTVGRRIVEHEPTVFDVRVYRSFGPTESAADQALSDIESRFPGVKLGFRAHFPEIQIKLTVKGPDIVEARARLEAAADEVKRRIGPHIFSDGDAIEAVIGATLRRDKATVSTVESCTGGMIAQLITNVPGASEYFDRGFVTYTEASKHELVGVPEALIAEFGVVSEECARSQGRSFARSSAARSSTRSRRLRHRFLRFSTRAATAAMSARMGAGPWRNTMAPSSARVKTPSDTRTWKRTKQPSVPLKRCPKVSVVYARVGRGRQPWTLQRCAGFDRAPLRRFASLSPQPLGLRRALGPPRAGTVIATFRAGGGAGCARAALGRIRRLLQPVEKGAIDPGWPGDDT